MATFGALYDVTIKALTLAAERQDWESFDRLMAWGSGRWGEWSRWYLGRAFL
jgi:hypothetical protein